MIVVDTNLFIYIVQGKLPAEVFNEFDVAYASVSRIEALGYSRLPVAEAFLLEDAFRSHEQIDLSDAVILRAVELRQRRRMGLGDAIISATALVQGAELWTANDADFAGIDGLKVHNPLAGKS